MPWPTVNLNKLLPLTNCLCIYCGHIAHPRNRTDHLDVQIPEFVDAYPNKFRYLHCPLGVDYCDFLRYLRSNTHRRLKPIHFLNYDLERVKLPLLAAGFNDAQVTEMMAQDPMIIVGNIFPEIGSGNQMEVEDMRRNVASMDPRQRREWAQARGQRHGGDVSASRSPRFPRIDYRVKKSKKPAKQPYSARQVDTLVKEGEEAGGEDDGGGGEEEDYVNEFHSPNIARQYRRIHLAPAMSPPTRRRAGTLAHPAIAQVSSHPPPPTPPARKITDTSPAEPASARRPPPHIAQVLEYYTTNYGIDVAGARLGDFSTQMWLKLGKMAKAGDASWRLNHLPPQMNKSAAEVFVLWVDVVVEEIMESDGVC